MKLIKMFLPMLVITLLATGCKKEYITYGTEVYTHEYKVVPAQWNRVQGSNLPGGGNYLYASFQNADIDAGVMNNGAVNAYVYNVYDVATNEGAWNALPFIYPLEVWVTNTAGDREMVISPETVRFEWEQGKVTFIIQELDGYDPEDMVQTLHFKVTVTK
ncbi:MAG: hypothetical protein IKS44_01165 [Bacteroidales bacterium]|nr:hypothetical protein [Bacteroidales bacterium]